MNSIFTINEDGNIVTKSMTAHKFTGSNGKSIYCILSSNKPCTFHYNSYLNNGWKETIILHTLFKELV